jgi:hypothetical protein
MPAPTHLRSQIPLVVMDVILSGPAAQPRTLRIMPFTQNF